MESLNKCVNCHKAIAPEQYVAQTRVHAAANTMKLAIIVRDGVPTIEERVFCSDVCAVEWTLITPSIQEWVPTADNTIFDESLILESGNLMAITDDDG